MDETELFKMSGASAGTIAIILLIYRLLKSVSGKRFISTCCGKKAEIGFEVKDALPTPKQSNDEIQIEMKNNPMLVDGNQLQSRTQRQEGTVG
jgi:hypothetical protein